MVTDVDQHVVLSIEEANLKDIELPHVLGLQLGLQRRVVHLGAEQLTVHVGVSHCGGLIGHKDVWSHDSFAGEPRQKRIVRCVGEQGGLDVPVKRDGAWMRNVAVSSWKRLWGWLWERASR